MEITAADVVRWAAGLIAALLVTMAITATCWTATRVSSYGERLSSVETKVDMIYHQLRKSASKQ